MLEKLNTFAGKCYLDLMISSKYPEQEPEYQNAKWYDLPWLIIPFLGWLIFIETIRGRKQKFLK